MRLSSSVKDITWYSLSSALILSMVLGLGGCSSGGSDSDDDSNSGGGGDFAPPSPGQACSAGNACDFTVQLSDQPDQLQNTASWTQQEFSYVHGFNGAPEQLTGKDYSWRSGSAQGTLFNYLQTTNFTDYNPLSASPPTALYVRDDKGISSGMTLQYGNQTLAGISSGEGYWFFDLTTPPFTLNPNKAPYQFTVHSYDSTGAQNRELAVWLSSEYITQGIPYTSVAELKSNGAKNHWMVADDSHIAYVGGLFDFAKSNPNGFNLNLDTDLDGKVMNLSTTYALFYVSNGVPADCVLSPTSCTLVFKGQYTTPVTGKITIAGAGRINGYDLLSETYPGKYSDYPNQDTQAWINMAQYRVNSGLIELSSSYNDGFNGPAIDIAGITVGFSPKRGDSSVLLNNRYLPMLTLEEAIAANGTPTAAQQSRNDQPVKVYDFKMVGNWVDAADGLEVHGRNSRLTYTYLHIADDSMKVSADNLTYEQTTVLQGDVQTGGLINIGSYGTGRPIPNGANVDGVYTHRITHKLGNCNGQDNGAVGWCGAALVASPTCQYGSDVKNVKITQLRVNNLGDDSSSVNKPFNIGLGDSYGSGSDCGNGNLTNVENLLFTDFKIFINPQSDSSIFDRGAGGGLLEPIGFYDGVNSRDVGGKVAIYPEANSFAYFICGNDNATQCWNTNGEGQGTVTNLIYSGAGFTEINFPYGP